MGELSAREAAVERAFAAHAGGVVALAARILRDDDAARDVCQETFVRFFDRMDEVRGDPGPWLRTVACRLALDGLRRRGGEARALAARPRGLAASGPGDPVEDAERREHVVAALAALSERQRAAVSLRLLVGETFPQIASALGCGEGAAKVHFRRGVDRLRTLLASLVRPGTVRAEEAER